MAQLFKLQNEKNWKTLLLDDNGLQFVNKSYSTVEEFVEKFEEKGLLKQRLDLSFLDINKITHPEKASNTATINYNGKKNDTNLELVFVDEASKENFVTTLAQKRGFNSSVNQVSVLKAIGPSLLGLGLTALFTFIVYEDAIIIESGGEVNTSGRRSLYKKLFAWLGEKLGSQGAIIAGSLIALVCIYFIYKNLKTKPTEVVYQ